MSAFVPSGIYGIIGYPLVHTLSPLLHTTAFRERGIPAVLVPWPVESGRLADFVSAVRLLGVKGACVTIPHKEDVIPLLDRVSDRAASVGAVNTLYWDGGELCGDNTDVPGFVAPLLAAPAAEKPRSALVLGAGGASRAVIAGLKSIGCAGITICNRTEATARAFAGEFGLSLCAWDERADVAADLVVNTTPLGMKGKFEGESPYPAEAFRGRKGAAYDIVYTPLKTRFLRDAEEAGWQTITGLGMFIAQADYQFRTWTGTELPETAKKAVYEALELDRAFI